MIKRVLQIIIVPAFLTACAGGTNNKSGALQEESLSGQFQTPAQTYNAPVADAAPSYLFERGPRYFIGTEYQIDGVSHLPIENMNYNETGIAGIIPAELQGNTTTNGEIFDNDKLFAAHKTLPLPTIVRVTNLDNGASTLVRVNNRGPFVNNRIMDVSQATAARLGMTGPTNVQITVQREESERLRDLTLGVSGGGSVESAPVSSGASGPYSVQVGAFFSRESAQAVADRIRHAGNIRIIEEGGMHKVRVVDLNADAARRALEAVRSENSAPGLLENGRWINPNSI